MLRKDRGFQGHGVWRFVHQGVTDISEQAVAGVVPGYLSDVQLLLLAVQDPGAVLHPVGPGRQGDSCAAGRNDVVAVGLGQEHAAPAVGAESGGELGDDGNGVAAAKFVLAT